MIVNERKDALVLNQQLSPGLYCPQVVANMHLACGLNSAEESLFHKKNTLLAQFYQKNIPFQVPLGL